jgi:lysophospholipase L1-like esterase
LANDNVLLFNSAEALAADGRIRPEYQVDLLHINAAGYAALNRKLLPALQTIARVH